MISDRNDFKPVNWNDNNASKDVSWILSAYTELREIRIGITSGKHREIGREGGVMGVMLGTESKLGIHITEVIPHAAADKAGVQVGDVIQKIDGRSVKKRDQVVSIVGKKDPGDVVMMQAMRKRKMKKLSNHFGSPVCNF